LGYFFHGKSNVVIFTKNVFGYILGDFFTNASGHPVRALVEPSPPVTGDTEGMVHGIESH
jgi:hypothetical protein